MEVARWLDKQPKGWKERIRWGALDMSSAYAAVYSVVLPKADQVVDPFHVIALANRALDSVRRRVQHELGGRQNKGKNPLYRARHLLLVGEERLGEQAAERLRSLLELGDPGAEVAIAYRVKERLRDFYRTDDPNEATALLDDLRRHCVGNRDAARAPAPRQDHRALVREDLQLAQGPRHERTHRSAQQPDQEDQTDRLRVQELRKLPDPGTSLRRQAELARARIDRGALRARPRQNPMILLFTRSPPTEAAFERPLRVTLPVYSAASLTGAHGPGQRRLRVACHHSPLCARFHL